VTFKEAHKTIWIVTKAKSRDNRKSKDQMMGVGSELRSQLSVHAGKYAEKRDAVGYRKPALGMFTGYFLFLLWAGKLSRICLLLAFLFAGIFVWLLLFSIPTNN
jgi:hypothetical protein